MAASTVVTRFAPSPTGFMHIGGVRTALFAYLWARRNRGTFILRIEDTDKEREVEGSIAHIMESLRWLGLEWDFGPDKPGAFGPLIQSERLDTYTEAARLLIEKGFAYPDPYSADELTALRAKAAAEKRPFLFRDHRPAAFGEWDGTQPLRFKVPEIKRFHWHDEVRGDLEAGEEMLDDFILIKSDGYPTYNFAHIIDDHHMQVTHIMRADEFIASTPRFLSLYEALGWEHPAFVTLPPIMREDKTKKLGKRDGAKDILEYRAEGFLPEAMLNFLAFIGWNPGTEQELFSKEALIETFDISGIQKHGGVSNEEKLLWYNREYLLAMDPAEFAREAAAVLKEALAARSVLWDDAIGMRLAPILRERTHVWKDIRSAADDAEYDFFFMKPAIDPAMLPGKNGTAATARTHLAAVSALLQGLTESDQYDPERVKDALWGYAEEQGRGAVLWPLRYALSGRARSPDPFAIISVIGTDDAQLRIMHALETLGE